MNTGWLWGTRPLGREGQLTPVGWDKLNIDGHYKEKEIETISQMSNSAAKIAM